MRCGSSENRSSAESISQRTNEKPFIVQVTVTFQHSSPRFPFKRNRLRCVRCVRNENRKKRKRLLASSQSWLPLLRPSIPIGWRLRLLRLRLRFLRFSFTQRMQRKRLHLNGNRASATYRGVYCYCFIHITLCFLLYGNTSKSEKPTALRVRYLLLY